MTITEQTKIGIGLAVVAIGGGAMWLSSMYFTGTANATDIAEVKVTQDQIADELRLLREGVIDLKTDLSEIKGELKHMRRK